MKINYKTICKRFNDHAASDSYDKPAALRVELTGFRSIHKAHRGRNGVGELVDLVTQVIEADGVHVAPSDRSNSITVYVRARTRASHGFGSDAGTFLRLRDAKGKYHSMELYKTWEENDIKVDGLMRALGEDTPAAFKPQRFNEFEQEEKEKVVKLVKDSNDAEGETSFRKERMRYEFARKFYQELVHDLDHERTEELQELVNFAGARIVTVFKFTDRVANWINPDYVDVSKQGLEIGFTERGTYNSLPATIRIAKVREIRMVKLADLGVELPRYYDHTDKMRVLPEQVEKVRRFAARFRSKQRKVIEKTLNEVRKVG